MFESHRLPVGCAGSPLDSCRLLILSSAPAARKRAGMLFLLGPTHRSATRPGGRVLHCRCGPSGAARH
jgi:hypothetical protein